MTLQTLWMSPHIESRSSLSSIRVESQISAVGDLLVVGDRSSSIFAHYAFLLYYRKYSIDYLSRQI